MVDSDPRFLRKPEQEAPDMPGSETVDLGDLGGDKDTNLIKLKPDALVVDLPDGSININFGGFGFGPLEEESSDHDVNLAMFVDSGTLGGIADDLMRLIGDDITRQEQKLQDVVKGIEQLGIQLEEPRSEPNNEGMSIVRHPLLLEAVLRFQANSRGEMLPADGPVKVVNEGDGVLYLDEVANQLEKDFNHYLTAGAPEYYPDTDRMYFSLGLTGEAYKKVYWNPLKRRPVSETIDRKDIILSDGAVSLEACGRITHRSRLRPSIVKQMQLVGAWRDTPLISGIITPDLNVVDKKLDEVAGLMAKMNIGGMEEVDREIYECYCELDLRGFEHKEDGEETGLPLPYRVTIDKESRQILEVRRWWEEGDPAYTRQETFVEYTFVPAFPGVNLGLLHILGNANRALTAAWRIALDNGMLANFPGGIMARSTGKQQTTSIRVGPGQVAPMDVDGVPLNQAFMPLPYRDVTGGFLTLIQNIEQASRQVGGTAETAVGEGRNDAPVGTTVALIEQAQKVMSAVHKRMHQAQQKEFMLFKDLFRRDPEALWRNNKNPHFGADKMKLLEALNNNDIVPKADPNTASQLLRTQKAVAIYTLAQQNPTFFDQRAVYNRIFSMMDIPDAESLYNTAVPAPPPVDPIKQTEAQAKMLSAQANLMGAQVKAQTAQAEHGIKVANLQTQGMDVATKRQIAQADIESKAREQQGKMDLERIRLAQSAIVHNQKLSQTERMKAADIKQKNLQKAMDLGHNEKVKGLDMESARRQQAQEIMHDINESMAQRIHEAEQQQREAAMQESAGQVPSGEE